MPKFPMFIVNETVPLVLKLNPSPNSISMDRSKVFTQTQTLGGWVFEHWGEEPRTLKVTGKTKPILSGNLTDFGEHTHTGVEYALFALQQVYNLDKRSLVDYVNILKDVKKKDNILRGKNLSGEGQKALSRTFIYYKFDLYNGFFTDFSYKQVGETMPRHYEYEFTFLVTSTLQNALVDNLFSGQFAAAGSLAGLAQIGTSGSAGAAVALLAGGKVLGAGGLNV